MDNSFQSLQYITKVFQIQWVTSVTGSIEHSIICHLHSRLLQRPLSVDMLLCFCPTSNRISISICMSDICSSACLTSACIAQLQRTRLRLKVLLLAYSNTVGGHSLKPTAQARVCTCSEASRGVCQHGTCVQRASRSAVFCLFLFSPGATCYYVIISIS
jgi:hypothetical protein